MLARDVELQRGVALSAGGAGIAAQLFAQAPNRWAIAVAGALLLFGAGALYVFCSSRSAGKAAERVQRRATYESTAGDGSDSSDAGDWHPLRHAHPFLQSMGLVDDPMDDIQQHTPRLPPKERIAEYIEENFTSFKLFIRIVGALAQVWGMLGLMYWSLLTRDGDLMDCLAKDASGAPRHGGPVRHFCTYTQACLRGFPILSANVTIVLMIRILMQKRIYYSLLHAGFVLDFADTNLMLTQWPLVCALSMGQGGVHLVLKIIFDEDPFSLGGYIQICRQFCLPGCIFLAFFIRYVEIENSLVPFNRLVELDYTKDNRKFQALGEMKAVYERIACWDARHRDVVGEVMDKVGRKPHLGEVIQSIIDNYDQAAEDFYGVERHFAWGFFRSLWPAALLVDRRLDWRDPQTRQWLIVISIMMTGCLVVSFCSLCFFISFTWRNVAIGWLHDEEYKVHGHRTETTLANVVLLCHAALVGFFLQRVYRGMFYFEIHTSEVPVESLRG